MKLAHEYAITAWMLSPIDEVMKDAKENHTGEDVKAVESLVVRLMVSHDLCSEAFIQKKATVLNNFWKEHEIFHSKGGDYSARPHIWKSDDLEQCRSHVWHKKNTLRFYPTLGKVACIVCSKILGIGSAERSWGDVKHLKTGKRSHLSAASIQMQATLFGAHCTEKAAIKREILDRDVNCFWDEDDFDHLGLAKYGAAPVAPQRQRHFNCWLEDWESENLKNNDVVVEAKLLRKYRDLQWYDPDQDVNFVVCSRRMHFSKTKGSRGWCVKALESSYDYNNERDDDWEPWELSKDLYGQIEKYYRKNPDPAIVIVLKPVGSDDTTSSEDEEDEVMTPAQRRSNSKS